MNAISRVINKIDLELWIFGTIKKVRSGMEWNNAWLETYDELDGKKVSCGKKPCSMNASRTLYELGRFKDKGIVYQKTTLKNVWDNKSVNGVYALVAIEFLNLHPNIELTELRKAVRIRVIALFGSYPDKGDQGAVKVAYIMWKLGNIVLAE